MLAAWTEKKKLCGRSNPCWSDFIKTLKLWQDLLFKFLVKAKVGKNYLRKVKTSKKISKLSFLLSDGTNTGRRESTYIEIQISFLYGTQIKRAAF